jgi:hypothetical protein
MSEFLYFDKKGMPWLCKNKEKAQGGVLSVEDLREVVKIYDKLPKREKKYLHDWFSCSARVKDIAIAAVMMTLAIGLMYDFYQKATAAANKRRPVSNDAIYEGLAGGGSSFFFPGISFPQLWC